ncbi:MAG TPA: alpha/beta hydrolase, partial [Acidimicrobiia bacterium]|nr:alpha/beta hydrolase [Acidimicrobiia bacterium]
CGPVLEPLAKSLGSRVHSVAVDERGHGATPRPPDGDFDWHGFARDVLAVVDELGLDRPLGFGHSCGGAALLLAEEARPGTFAALYCFEPIVLALDEPLPPDLGNPLSVGALRRRSTFASRREAIGNFTSKAPFDRLRPDVLAAYVDNGFMVTSDGALELRCRREDEAEVYAHSLSHDTFAHLDAVRCPVTLACGATTDAMGEDLLRRLAARLPHPSVEVFAGLGHFGPLEDPDVVGASAARALVPDGDTPRA